MVAGEALDQRGVQRLAEAGVGHALLDPQLRERQGFRKRGFEPGGQRQNGGVGSLAPLCEEFMRIGPMAYIPDQLVARRVKNIVLRHGEFDDTKPPPKWPPVSAAARVLPVLFHM